MYKILYPSSQSFCAAMREECARPGTIWASVTVDGGHGILRLHVCVDVRMMPSGRVTCSGVIAGLMLTAGVSAVRKFAVVLVSLYGWVWTGFNDLW